MITLTNASIGVYTITTETGSEYLVDLRKRTLIRSHARLSHDVSEKDITRLPDDNIPVKIVYLVTCVVGNQAVFVVEPHFIESVRGIRKTTTKIVSITRH